MSEQRNIQRLHPVSIVVNLIKTIKSMIIPLVIILVGRGFEYSLNPTNENYYSTLIFIGVGLLIIISVISLAIIRWRKFVYWFEDGELRVEYGLVITKKRYIPFERIQSLNYKESIFHRPLKLVSVTVETASDQKDAEAELTAVSRQQAEEIEYQMEIAKQQTIENNKEPLTENQIEKTVIYKVSNKELILLASTSSSMGILFSAIAAIATQFNEIIPYEEIYGEMQNLIKFGVLFIVLIVLAVVLVSWFVAIAISYFANYGFQVIEEDNKLFISKGLLEKKRLTVPMNRIQGITIIENPIRQIFGYCRVVLISAGGSGESNEDKTVLLPFVKKSTAIKVLAQLFPQYNLQQNYIKAPRKSLLRYLLKPQYYFAIPIVLCSIYFYPIGLFSCVVIPPVLLLTYWQYKTAAFSINGYQLTMIYRLFSKHTFITEKKRIQSITQKQSFFAERKDIASAVVHVMSGNSGEQAYAKHFDLHEIEEIMAWYKPNH
ncbi:PH domain-containing protein [Kurthia sibirica]|nr:PH domain-containing protein [Kurthia sibirica]